MSRALAMILALGLLGTPALAGGFTPAQRAACETDYRQYCADVVPGGGRIIACLKQNIDKISEKCRKMIKNK
jgi:hypothetical protein